MKFLVVVTSPSIFQDVTDCFSAPTNMDKQSTHNNNFLFHGVLYFL